MDRRRFLLTSLAGALAAPLATEAQQTKVPRIISVVPGPVDCRSPSDEARRVQAAFRHGLAEQGFVPGQNVRQDSQCFQAETQLTAMITEVVRQDPTVIVVTGTRAALAAKRATTTIPIVFAGVGDAVRVGLVESLAKPGANVTGVSNMRVELGPKQLQILKDVIPSMSRVAVLIDPTPESSGLLWRELQIAADTLKLTLVRLEARSSNEIDSVFQRQIKGAEALVVVPSGTFWVQRPQISGLAMRNLLPSMFPWVEKIDAGGLFAYGVSDVETFRIAGRHVGKILRGVRPADLPVEQPSKFELVINLKTAKALGLTIPPSLLARADQVIE
jgi:ABC-type uncharacterized transport system substrate-binding protein